MSLTCWVCRAAIADGEARTTPATLPRRLRGFEGQPVHLRCHGDWAEVRCPGTPSRRDARPKGAIAAGTTLLFAEDIAALRGISPRQARRWLQRLEEQHGTKAVGQIDARRGTRRYTTRAALESIGPRLQHAGDQLAALVDRVRAVEQRVGELERTAAADGHPGTHEARNRPS
jgi:hypothetical protein